MKKGWYPDPTDPEQVRWWNGQSWTKDTRSLEEAREQILKKEGEEIELEQGAREAIERRRRALQEAGRASSQAEPRRRRRRRMQSADSKDTLAEDEKTSTEDLSPPSSENPIDIPPPSFNEAPKKEEGTLGGENFPDLEGDSSFSESAEDLVSSEELFVGAKEVSENKEDLSEDVFASFEDFKPLEDPPAQKTSPKPKKPAKTAKKQKSAKPSKISKAGAFLAAQKDNLAKKRAARESEPLDEDAPKKKSPWKKLLVVLAPASLVIIVAGAIVWLPGGDEEKKDLTYQSSTPTQPKKPKKSPAQLEREAVGRCIESSPGVNSFITEENSEGEESWKIIFVDDNYELITVTKKANVADAKLDAEVSATSFIAASSGRFSIIGPLRGIEGSQTTPSSKLVKYIGSLKTCLAKI